MYAPFFRQNCKPTQILWTLNDTLFFLDTKTVSHLKVGSTR